MKALDIGVVRTGYPFSVPTRRGYYRASVFLYFRFF
jgi:hypothetical protein